MNRILIVKPSSLGDIIHAFPAVSLLAEKYPDIAVDWLVHPAFVKLLDYMPCVERPIIFRRKELGAPTGFIPAFLELFKSIRHDHYDAVIDLQGLLRSSGMAFLARAKRRVGYAHPKESLASLLYTDRIDVPASITHAADRNTALVSSFLGIPFESRDYVLPVSAKSKDGAMRLFRSVVGDLPSPLVGLIPGARWDTKRWPPSFFADCVRKMIESRPGLFFAIFGSPSDMQIARDIISCLGPFSSKVVDMTGRTSIGELVESLRLCSVALSNDSGPMHIAAAAGVPLIALFGPTRPELTGPRSGKALVMRPDIDCIGCMKRYCQKGLCQISIEPGEAAKAALKLI